MNLSHAYGPPQTRDAAERVLRRALDLGVTHFDTAALYGFGANEELVGAVLAQRPANVIVASKCGLFGRNGKRVIDGRPESIHAVCEQSLRNLRTDRIDLYYLHRWDKIVPIEDSVGALADLVRAGGKVRADGLSEVGAATLRGAHAVHPIAAVQSGKYRCGPAIRDRGARRNAGKSARRWSHSVRWVAAFCRAPCKVPPSLPKATFRVACRAFRVPTSRRTAPRCSSWIQSPRAGCTAQLALAWSVGAPHIRWLFRAPRGSNTSRKTVVQTRFVSTPQRLGGSRRCCPQGRPQGLGILLRRRSKMTPKTMGLRP
jgi:hypothetical protein